MNQPAAKRPTPKLSLARPAPWPASVLTDPLTSIIKGPSRALASLTKEVGARVIDLALFAPRKIIQRRKVASLAEAQMGEEVLVQISVLQHRLPNRFSPARVHRVLVSDNSGFCSLAFFNRPAAMLQSMYPPNSQWWVAGKVSEFRGERQIVHPKRIIQEDLALNILDVRYSLSTERLDYWLRQALALVIPNLPPVSEWLAPAVLNHYQWPNFKQALQHLHYPEPDNATARDKARSRLAYDEMLAQHLTLLHRRAQQKTIVTTPLPPDTTLRPKVVAGLPYQLTTAQQQALADIDADLSQPSPMARLLQGDVGSGKTVVALLAMLRAAAAGRQAALMAPTEILVQQHYRTFTQLLAGTGEHVVMLSGGQPAPSLKQARRLLQLGHVRLAVGTHALFQAQSTFADLALIVIDEQHRFGVDQRQQLINKAQQPPHCLSMSATPIPRTFMLTMYGDLDVSRLNKKPPGRSPIITRVIDSARLDEISQHMQAVLPSGAKIYWVCPLIEETEESDLASVTMRAAWLRERLGEARVAMIHGKMNSSDKNAALKKFQDGTAPVLVGTTVIEVGVDVPEATIIIIEHAERFGLAQLHQLRGRVGRGNQHSSCVLLYSPPLSGTATQRLELLKNCDDGFVLAEEDLRLRGAGEILGTRQTGLPNFRIFEYQRDSQLIDPSYRDAQYRLAKGLQPNDYLLGRYFSLGAHDLGV